MRTMTLLPFALLVTRSLLPSGSVRWAAVNEVVGRVLAMGGFEQGRTQLVELLLELTGKPRPTPAGRRGR